jgi:hypothetical protein
MTATGRTVYAQAMTEADLLAAVIDLAHLYGLRTAHFRPAWTEKGWRTAVSGDGKGWPDLVILGTRLIVRELKTETGRVPPAQQQWLAALAVAGIDAAVWRPQHWLDGTIRAELEGLRHG